MRDLVGGMNTISGAEGGGEGGGKVTISGAEGTQGGRGRHKTTISCGTSLLEPECIPSYLIIYAIR